VLQGGYHTLTNNGALEFRHGGDDVKHRLSHRCTRIQSFLMANEVNTEASKLLEGKHELFDTAGKPIEAPDQDNMEFPTASVSHECLQAWPGLLGAAHPVGVNAEEVPSPLLDQRPQRLELDFWILQWSWDTAIFLDPSCRATDIDRRLNFRGGEWRVHDGRGLRMIAPIRECALETF
jgi:hypothetical protein